MKTPRSTEIAERLLIILCLLIIAFFTGRATVREENGIKCKEVRKMSLGMTPQQQAQFINYYRSKAR